MAKANAISHNTRMFDPGTWTAKARLVRGLLLLGVTALLLVPAEPSAQRVSWDDLIEPLAVGLPVTRGYFLSPPRRGEEHDVVFVARRDPGPDGAEGRVEVHIVDRGHWSDVQETRSFGIAWELPPSGTLVVAPAEDQDAVTDKIVEAIAKNDSGFASVNSVALASEPAPPLVVRVLERLSGLRGVAIGATVALALILLASVPYGSILVAVLLFALGLALRASCLNLPFAHDQDVQRLFTGHLSLYEIATGAGLKDRHPPLYFFLLHFVEQFGQSEAIVRAPAVIAGALIGPALLLAVAGMCGRVGPAAALIALIVTVSPQLVARSREVSEIPLFALFVVAATASLLASIREPRRGRLLVVVLSHALALFTYYLAPFVIAAHAAILIWWRKTNRRVLVAFVAGVAAGLPALALGAVTLLRDRGARAVARQFPAFAWGEHSPVQIATHMGSIAAEAFGLPLLLLVLATAVIGSRSRSLTVITPSLAAAVTCAGIALLSPIARVQAYYVTTVLPLAALLVAVYAEESARSARVSAALVLIVVFSTAPAVSRMGPMYLPDADAFMQRFARIIAQRPETKIVTIAHYDKALLAYYLAQAEGRAISWDNIDDFGSRRVEPLVMVHSLDTESEAAAATRLNDIIDEEPVLVIERDAFLLPSLVERLASCEPLLKAPSGRLLRCASNPQP